MASTVSLSAPDLAGTLQNAVSSLAKVIESKPDADRLLAEMVRICGQALQAGGAGVWVTEMPEHPELILEHNLAQLQLLVDGEPIAGTVVAVRRCVREVKPLIVPAFFVESDAPDSPVNPSAFELLYVPMKLHGKVAMVLLMAVPPPANQDAGLHRTYLNFLVRMVGAIEQTLAERHLNLIEKDRGTSSKLVRYADQVHKHLFAGQVAVDVANLARDVLESQRVTVELYPRARKRVIAVSNVDEPNKRANVLQVQRLVFDYVRDRHVPVMLDREAVKQLISDPVLQDAASAYFAATDFDAFLAAPIKSDDPTAPVLGVIIAEYKHSGAAQSHQGLLAEVARLTVSSVTNAIEMESVPFLKTLKGLRDLWRKPTGTKRKVMLSVLGVILVIVAIIGVIPFDFSIKADCQIRPTAQLPIVAPVEQRIIDVPVHAGDHVYPKSKLEQFGPEKVKPLVVFDSTEYVSQKAAAIGKKAELEVQQNEASKKGESMAKISGLRLQVTQMQDQIALLDHQIEECTVWSPIEGTVLTENVEQKRWSTPRKGDALMEVASFSDFELVVDVPESEVAGVRGALERATRLGVAEGHDDNGIEIEYVLKAFPDTGYNVRARGVSALLPSAQQNKDANVFHLQAKLDPASFPPGLMLSGLEGRARVHIGRKPLATQWTRGAVRMLKMTLLF